ADYVGFTPDARSAFGKMVGKWQLQKLVQQGHHEDANKLVEFIRKNMDVTPDNPDYFEIERALKDEVITTIANRNNTNKTQIIAQINDYVYDGKRVIGNNIPDDLLEDIARGIASGEFDKKFVKEV